MTGSGDTNRDIVDRAKAALKDVTPTPWVVECVDEWDGYNVYYDDGKPGTAYICEDIRQGENGIADAAFIAAARSLVPELVAEIEQARSDIANLQRLLRNPETAAMLDTAEQRIDDALVLHIEDGEQ